MFWLRPPTIETSWLCGGYVTSLIPALTNVLGTNTDESTMVFFADPFLRGDHSDLETDPVIEAVRSLMLDSLEVLFVDDWMAYRENLGNVGTGTNVKRTAPRTCWNDGGHLFAAA